jgi:hypothetical protein
MQRDKVFIPDLGLTGEIIRAGYLVSLIGYTDLGVQYEVYMENTDFIEVEQEEDDAL